MKVEKKKIVNQKKEHRIQIVAKYDTIVLICKEKCDAMIEMFIIMLLFWELLPFI